MCLISMPAVLLNRASERWAVVPRPDVPADSSPRFAFASAISSLIDAAGRDGLATHSTALSSPTRLGVRLRDGHRLEIAQRIIFDVLIGGDIDGQRRVGREEQRVAIGRRLGHEVGPDVAAGAGAVFDDDRLAPGFRQPRPQETGQDIDRAARRIGHDDANRMVGIIGLRKGRPGQQSGQRGNRGDRACHGNSSHSALPQLSLRQGLLASAQDVCARARIGRKCCSADACVDVRASGTLGDETCKVKVMRLGSLFAVILALAAPNVALADPVADFYRGKQLKVIIRAAPGGNYDLYLRLLARHIVRHIPGNPTAVPMNMPGGGGLTSLNYFDKVAPHDGTALTMVTQTQPMDQALGLDKSGIDMRALNWIGNMSGENSFLVTRRTSPTKTLEEAKQRETTLAATGAGGSEVMLVSILNQFLGTKFKNIIGYRNSPEMNLAMERGETDGRITTNLRALFTTHANGADGFNVLVQVGLQADKD